MMILNAVVEQQKMRINDKKIKVMKTGKNREDFITRINGNQLDQEKRFKYLGSLLKSDRSCEQDTGTRISIAKEAFNKLCRAHSQKD